MRSRCLSPSPWRGPDDRRAQRPGGGARRLDARRLGARHLLGIEHLTGSLSAAITHVGTDTFPGPVQLLATTKFGEVGPLLDLPHGGRTRIRASVNARGVAGYPPERMRELRAWFAGKLERRIPAARPLYWT